MSITRSSPVQVAAFSTTFSQAPKLVSTSWSKISVGPSHVLALKSNNTLYAWGINTDGQVGDGTTISRSSPVQIGNPSYTWNDISAGINYSVGLRGDGLLFTWGLNTTGVLGDLNVAIGAARSSPIQVGTSSWNAVSAGGTHVVAIRSDRSLWAWGLNSLGQLGISDFVPRSSPVQVSSSSWSIISAGQTHSTAITTDGKLYTWGDNTAGTLGYTTPAQSYFSWTSVAGNADYTVAIRNDGLLFAWGTNNFGQLGDNSTINRSSPVQIGTSSWTVVSANAPTSGGGPVLAIRSDGTLWGWGLNAVGQLGLNDVANRSSPVQVSGGGSWSSVASSKSHTLAIKSTDGLLYAWGFNTSGQLGTNDLISRSSPVQVASIITSYLLTFNSATAVDNSGNNNALTVGAGTPTIGNAIIPFSGTFSAFFGFDTYYNVGTPALGTQFTIDFWVYITQANNGNWYWTFTGGGFPMIYTIGNGTSTTSIGKVNAGGSGNFSGAVSLANNTWAHIAFTRNSANLMTIWLNGASVVTSTDGTSYTGSGLNVGYVRGGNSGSGMLGYMSNFRIINNYTAYTAAFTRPTTASPASISIYGTFTPANRVTAISVGDISSYAIKNDNKLYTWGSGAQGASGLNDIVSRSSPVQIGSNSWTSVYAYGTSYVNAIDSNSKLFAWGANAGGQQGYGDSVQRSSPVQISNGNWSTLGAYSTLTNTLGIQTDGSLWAWGSKTNVLLGEFSNGSYTYSWSQVSAGPSHTAAVRSDGRLYIWGLNSAGQIGNGTTTNTSSPTLITTIPGVTSEFWNRVAVNGLRTVAVRNDGTLWTWGSNAGYLLGTGDSINRSRPIQIANSISSDSTNANVFSTYFNGTTDYLSVPTAVFSSIDGVSTSYTLECWIYPTVAADSLIMAIDQSGQTSGTFFYMASTRAFGITNAGANNYTPVLSATGVVPLNAWSHLCLSKSGSTARLYFNGILQTTVTVTAATMPTFTNTTIGARFTTVPGVQGALTGYLSNLRLVVGTAVYTSDFTPSTAPLTAITNTKLLTLQNTTFIDNGTANSGVGYTITVAGDPYTGQNFTPFSGYITPRSWTGLSAGLSHTLAVSSLGRMYVWGDNTFNQIGDGTTVTLRSQPVQIGTSSWSQVSSYGNHSLAIDINNKLYAWGDNTLGQVGVSSSPLQWTTVNSYYTAQMIRNDGIVYAMGLNNGGQIGDSSVASRSSPVQVSGGGSWTQLVSGYDGTNFGYTLGIKTDGTLYAWGLNTSGILGDSTLATTVTRSSPVQVGTSSWLSVSTMNNSVIAIRSDYTMWAWGKNDQGQLGQGDTASRSSPVQIGTSSWTQVSVGVSSAVAIKLDSTLFTWGLNTSGQLGDGTGINKSSPVQVGVGNSYIQISGKSFSKFAIRNDYTLWSWGINTNGELGLTDAVSRSSPVQVNVGFIYDSISSGFDHVIGKRRDGTIWSWGLNTAGQVGDITIVSRSSPVQVGTSSWVSVNAGYKNTFGITVSAINGLQNLYAWGSNVNGEFGLGDTAYRSSPVQIGSGQQLQFVSSPTQIGTSSWTTISAGLSNSMAIRSDYKLFTWGNNVQLQSGYITPATTLGTASKTNNDAQSFIRSTDNALIIWGANDVGQLGDNTVANRSNPVQLGLGLGYSQFTKIARAKVATAGYTLSVRTDGTLWSWGSGTSGALGNLSTVNRSSPVQVGALTTWSDVAAGPSHALAIKSDGSLWGWGLNTSGQAGVLSWAKVSSGSSHTLAIRSDGQMYGWGRNAEGQVGDISIVTRSSPVQIGTGFSWNSISAGINISAAIRGDNRLFTWGLNTSGQLGLGDATTNRSSPTQVGTSFWTQVSANNYMMALTTTGRLYTWGTNTNGQLGDGTTTNKSSPGELYPPVNYKSLFINGQGSGSNITTASNANLALGATDHTVEFWVYQIDNSAASGNFIDRPIASTGTTSAWGMDFGHGNYNPNNIQWWSVQLDNTQNYSAFGSLMSTTKPANWYNNWHHIAVTRKITTNSVYTMYLDGVQVSTYTHAGVGDFSTDTTLQIDYRVYGYMRDIRITKSLVYTGNFSVPTSALTALPNTVLLVNLGNTVPIDYSTNNIALTVNNVTVSYTYPTVYPSTFLVGDTDWSSNFTAGTASLATKTSGALYAWGLNTSGQLGLNDVVSRSSPTQIGSSSWGIVSSTNGAHTLGLTVDGKLFTWGLNNVGQLGLGDTAPRSSPAQVGASSWSSVDAGGSHSSAIRTDGVLFVWGLNTAGRLGLGDTINRSSPVAISGSTLPNSSSVYFNGVNDYLALTSNAVFAFGTGTFTIECWFYCTNTSVNQAIYDTRSPVDTANIGYNIYIAGATSSIRFGTSGSEYVTGPTNGVVVNTWNHVAVVRESLTVIKMYLNGTQHSTTFTASATQNFTNNTPRIGNGVQGFFNGYISNLRVISGQALYTGTFTPSTTALTNNAVGSTGAGAAASITGTVVLLICQSNTFVDNSVNNFALQIAGMPVALSTSYTQVNAGESNTTFIASNGVLFNTGDNTTGQIGDGTTVSKSFLQVVANPSLYDNRSSPAQIGTGSWSQIAAGLNYSLALKSDGTLYTWGDNTSGYLGDGTTLTRRSMSQIGTNSYVSISSGGSHTVALRTDLTLYAWGLNSAGQLGDNSVVSRSSPVQVNTGLVTSWNSVSAGASHTVAIDATYNLPYGWGLNSSGQIGDNTLVSRSSPVQISLGSTLNYSYQFNGTTQYLTSAASASYQLTSNFTIEFWFYATTITAQHGLVIINDAVGPNSASGLDIFINTGSILSFWVNGNGGGVAGPSVTTGVWYHVALVRSASTNTLYVNGVSSATSSTTPTWSATPSIGIGRLYNDNTGSKFNGYISNVRIVKGTALYTSGFYPSAGALTTTSQGATASQVLLLTAQSATIVDNSLTPITFTNTGTVTATTTNPFGPYYSGSFNGTSQYLQVANNASNQMGTGDWTAEAWIYITTYSTINMVFAKGGSSTDWFLATNNSNGRLYTGIGTSDYFASTGPIVSLNSWAHVALVRSGTTLSTYLNGVLGNTLTGVTQNFASTGALNLGRGRDSSTNYLTGYISNARLVKGTAVYTGNFTVPTNILRTTQSAMTNIVALTGTETVLLTLQSATIVDNSTNTFTITNNGSVPITTAVAPFTASTASGAPSTFDSIQAGVTSTMATSNNTLFTWGAGTTGQLGDNSITGKSAPTTTGVGSIWSVQEKLFSSPVQVGTAKSWSLISAGSVHTVAMATDYSLWAWGQNTAGQAGDSTTVGKSSPTQIAGNTSSYTFITAGVSDTFAIRTTTNLLFAWGLNTSGQLGLNDVANRSSPVQIFAGTMAVPLIPIRLNTVSGSSYTVVQAGSAASVIDSIGRLFTWGTNTAGQVADNTTINRSSPVQLGGLQLTYIQSPVQVGSSSYSQVSAGYSHTLAIDTNSLLYAWGKTPANGATVNRSSPVQIGSNSWLFVSAGVDASQAIDSTRTLYAWGLNTNYQLGSASFSLNQSVTSPVAIGTLAINTASHTNSVGSGNSGFIKNI